jgi:hypothetical protein
MEMTFMDKINFINQDFRRSKLFRLASEIPDTEEKYIPFVEDVVSAQETYIRRYKDKGNLICRLVEVMTLCWVEGIEEECKKRFKG